jgi:hypothetical protein
MCLWLQVVLVSATLPNEVLQMTQQFMTDPVRILVKRDELTLEVRWLALLGVGAIRSCSVSLPVGGCLFTLLPGRCGWVRTADVMGRWLGSLAA